MNDVKVMLLHYHSKLRPPVTSLSECWNGVKLWLTCSRDSDSADRMSTSVALNYLTNGLLRQEGRNYRRGEETGVDGNSGLHSVAIRELL